MKESGANVFPRARMNGPLICAPVMAHIGTLPAKTGCYILELPADPSMGFLAPFGIVGIFGGAAATGAGAGAGAGAASTTGAGAGSGTGSGTASLLCAVV